MSSLEQRLAAPLFSSSTPLFTAVRLMVRDILRRPLDEKWAVNGRGALRVQFGDEERWQLSIWDRTCGFSTIREPPWVLNTWVIAGRGVFVRYEELVRPIMPNYNSLTVKTGMVDSIYLQPTQPAVHEAGDQFTQAGIHANQFADGSVTLSTRIDRTAEYARIFWPIGEQRVEVKPRAATGFQVWSVTQRSLNNWF